MARSDLLAQLANVEQQRVRVRLEHDEARFARSSLARAVVRREDVYADTLVKDLEHRRGRRPQKVAQEQHNVGVRRKPLQNVKLCLEGLAQGVRVQPQVEGSLEE